MKRKKGDKISHIVSYLHTESKITYIIIEIYMYI